MERPTRADAAPPGAHPDPGRDAPMAEARPPDSTMADSQPPDSLGAETGPEGAPGAPGFARFCDHFNAIRMTLHSTSGDGATADGVDQQPLTQEQILPAGLCPLAFHAVYPYIRTLSAGGWFNWVGYDEHVIVNCPAPKGIAMHVKAPQPAAEGAGASSRKGGSSVRLTVMKAEPGRYCGYRIGDEFAIFSSPEAARGMQALDRFLALHPEGPASGESRPFVIEADGAPLTCRMRVETPPERSRPGRHPAQLTAAPNAEPRPPGDSRPTSGSEVTMQEQWRGKVALVTGASRGVGRATAVRLGGLGMKVGLLARGCPNLEHTAEAVRAAGGEALDLPADLRHSADVERAVGRLEEIWETPHLLVNNAGVGARGFWSDLSLKTEQDIMAVNYTAAVTLIRLILPGMLAEGRGHIINISSIAGLFAAPYQGAYCASKAALVSYCDSLGHELEGTPVHLSTLFPGPIETDFLANPNYDSFRDAGDKVTPAFMAEQVLALMNNPRERAFPGPAWKLLAVKLVNLHPTFFRGLIERKNTPPKRWGSGHQD